MEQCSDDLGGKKLEKNCATFSIDIRHLQSCIYSLSTYKKFEIANKLNAIESVIISFVQIERHSPANSDSSQLKCNQDKKKTNMNTAYLDAKYAL